MIVIPMAGLSRRFTVAGYTVPKYMLPLHGTSVFCRAVGSFEALFETTPFLFIARPLGQTEAFIRRECANLGIVDARIVILNRETAGQAETVELGLREIETAEYEPITIFNIDTFRKGFQYPKARWFTNSDGFIEVFRGTGSNWSYVGPMAGTEEPLAECTAEKRPISDLCCNGLYHFARASDFLAALALERAEPSMPELYVAPLYNHLIARGRRIHYDLVSNEVLTFCGVPSEYEAVLNSK